MNWWVPQGPPKDVTRRTCQSGPCSLIGCENNLCPFLPTCSECPVTLFGVLTREHPSSGCGRFPGTNTRRHLASSWAEEGRQGSRVSDSWTEGDACPDRAGRAGATAIAGGVSGPQELLTASCRPSTRPGWPSVIWKGCLVPISLFCKEQFLKSRGLELCSSLIGPGFSC